MKKLLNNENCIINNLELLNKGRNIKITCSLFKSILGNLVERAIRTLREIIQTKYQMEEVGTKTYEMILDSSIRIYNNRNISI